MRIAQIVPSLVPQGPVRVALDLGYLLRQRGHRVDFYYFDSLEGSEDPGGQRERLSWHAPQWGGHYDVIHSHGLRPDLYTGWYHKRLPSTVHTLHNYLREDLRYQYGPLKMKAAELLWNRACKNHAASVVLSRDMEDYYHRFWRQQRFRIIPNTRRIELSSQAALRQEKIRSWAAGRPVMISLSTASQRKNLEALLPFLQQEKDWCYVHVGGGALNRLQEKARAMGLEARCLWLGPQARGWEFLPAADVFMLPSRSEGFPLSLLEAVKLKVPAVTSDLPVFRELFDGQEVARFTLNDDKSLRESLSKVRQDGKARAERAFRRYQSQYSPEVVAGAYEKLYQEIL